MPTQYRRDFRDRAVRMVTAPREAHETEWVAIQVIVSGLSVGAETVRKWMCRSEIDAPAKIISTLGRNHVYYCTLHEHAWNGQTIQVG